MAPLLALRCRVGLGANIRRGGAGVNEEAREDWVQESAEDNLGAVCHWEGHPEDQDELEDVVEGCLEYQYTTPTCRDLGANLRNQ